MVRVPSLDELDAEALPGIEVGATVTVINSDVNLRTAPSLEGEPIAALHQGQALVLTGPAVESDGFVWLPVSDPADPSLTGFAATNILVP